jgi:hypothetical protein
MDGLCKTDADIRDCNEFVVVREEAISVENGAWMTEVVKEHHQRDR